MSAPSLRERVEALTPLLYGRGDEFEAGYNAGYLSAVAEAAAIAASGDATIATQAARIVDLLREIEQRRLDWDKERTAFVVKAREQAARIAELEAENDRLRIAGMHRVKSLDLREECERLRAEVARLSAPVGVEPVAWRYRLGAVDQWTISTTPIQDFKDGGVFDVELLFPESALRTLQARLEAAEGDALSKLRIKILEIPVRREWIGGQRANYVQVDEVLGWIDAARSAGTGEAGA
jgi:hypothetical protein